MATSRRDYGPGKDVEDGHGLSTELGIRKNVGEWPRWRGEDDREVVWGAGMEK